jgi:hypothetical protein
MMSRKLEEFIRENKKAFDTENPSEELWSRIEKGLDQKKTSKPINLTLWIGVAASVLLVVGITAALLSSGRRNSGMLADVNPDYARKQVRFASMIEEKKDSLEVLSKVNPALYSKFNRDIEHMDADYQKLKKELADSPNQKLVVRAMVKNLELQLQVITQQLMIINQVNQYKKENQI